jgi:hypothetical protein
MEMCPMPYDWPRAVAVGRPSRVVAYTVHRFHRGGEPNVASQSARRPA